MNVKTRAKTLSNLYTECKNTGSSTNYEKLEPQNGYNQIPTHFQIVLTSLVKNNPFGKKYREYICWHYFDWEISLTSFDIGNWIGENV